jgi:hypothetical protein
MEGEKEATKEGIYKLFDIMKSDLGQQQTEDMKHFYEMMHS